MHAPAQNSCAASISRQFRGPAKTICANNGVGATAKKKGHSDPAADASAPPHFNLHFQAGGGGRTRTYEGLASGFTVRPLCRSGHSPAKRVIKHSQEVTQWLGHRQIPHSEMYSALHSENLFPGCSPASVHGVCGSRQGLAPSCAWHNRHTLGQFDGQKAPYPARSSTRLPQARSSRRADRHPR
jgi:hypothetical protein